jgi:hypothetical protein
LYEGSRKKIEGVLYMEDQNVYRDCFFTKSPEAFTKIKRLKEDYDDVTSVIAGGI